MPRIHSRKIADSASASKSTTKKNRSSDTSKSKKKTPGSYIKSMYRPKEERDQFAKTPETLYDQLNRENHFDFDPCPVDPKFDGLSVAWGQSNYVNPPYNDIESWVKKALEEKKLGKKSVFLIPVRTSTKYFHNLILPNAEKIEFLEGRIKFQGYESSAPFCSMLVYF